MARYLPEDASATTKGADASHSMLLICYTVWVSSAVPKCTTARSPAFAATSTRVFHFCYYYCLLLLCLCHRVLIICGNKTALIMRLTVSDWCFHIQTTLPTYCYLCVLIVRQTESCFHFHTFLLHYLFELCNLYSRVPAEN